MVQVLYKGRKRLVHVGKKGGKYVIVEGNKRYLKPKTKPTKTTKGKPVKRKPTKAKQAKKKVVKRKSQKRKPGKRKIMKGGTSYNLNTFPIFNDFAKEFFPMITFELTTMADGDVISFKETAKGKYLCNATLNADGKTEYPWFNSFSYPTKKNEFQQGYRCINLTNPSGFRFPAKICPVFKANMETVKANTVIHQNTNYLFPNLHVTSTADALAIGDVQLALVMLLTCNVQKTETGGRIWNDLATADMLSMFKNVPSPENITLGTVSNYRQELTDLPNLMLQNYKEENENNIKVNFRHVIDTNNAVLLRKGNLRSKFRKKFSHIDPNAARDEQQILQKRQANSGKSRKKSKSAEGSKAQQERRHLARSGLNTRMASNASSGRFNKNDSDSDSGNFL